MSKISDVYDAVIAEVAALFPTKMQLPDAINPEQNTDLILKNGFGIKWGAGLNTNRNLACRLSVGTALTVVLTKRTYSSEILVADTNNAMKAMLEDYMTLVRHFENEPELLSGDVAKFVYLVDTGVLNVNPGDFKFIKMEVTFNQEFFEKLIK